MEGRKVSLGRHDMHQHLKCGQNLLQRIKFRYLPRLIFSLKLSALNASVIPSQGELKLIRSVSNKVPRIALIQALH